MSRLQKSRAHCGHPLRTLASLQEEDPSAPQTCVSSAAPVLLRVLDTGPPSRFLLRPSDLCPLTVLIYSSFCPAASCPASLKRLSTP